MDSTTKITKETKKTIRVDYEGKLSFKERFLNKLKASNTWIKVAINILRFILMLGVSYVILYPFFAKIAGSFMTKEDVVDATVAIIPKHFTLDIYKYMITENNYFEALLNTVLISLFCAIIQTLIACLIGYGLAKFKFKGNNVLFVAVVLTMIIPHRTMKMSLIQHFTDFDFLKVNAWDYRGIIDIILGGNQLDLSNTFWPLIILSLFGLAFKNGLYIYLMRQFFKGVPDELEESAYVDGSGVFRTFFSIIMPLSVPMMITIFLFSFSWQWTDNFYTQIFFMVNIDKMYLMPDLVNTIPPSLMVEGFAGQALYENVIRNTAAIMIIFPLVIMYLFCQKYLVQGIERSGLVG
ncbi:MAG: carbohydrate ABC transporter permease [Clostridia bacterium]|nr:carbohydrate ABC transporter permease [Clostridia bacterium]